MIISYLMWHFIVHLGRSGKLWALFFQGSKGGQRKDLSCKVGVPDRVCPAPCRWPRPQRRVTPATLDMAAGWVG